MRARLILITLFIALAIANYLPFTQSAYWTNADTFLGQNSTYQIGQTNSPDNSSDYQLTSSTLPTCYQANYTWEMDHHLLRATSDYNGTQGSAYDVIYDSNRCGLSGLPRLCVYKVVSGSATLLLNVQLAGDQANQPFTTFIRNDGPNPGLHIKLGFTDWHVSDTSITSGYPGYAFTDGTNAQYIPGTYALAPTYNEIDRLAPNTPTNLQTMAWPTIIDLQWSAPTDQGTGVKTYLLYKNGTYVTSTTSTTYFLRRAHRQHQLHPGRGRARRALQRFHHRQRQY